MVFICKRAVATVLVPLALALGALLPDAAHAAKAADPCKTNAKSTACKAAKAKTAAKKPAAKTASKKAVAKAPAKTTAKKTVSKHKTSKKKIGRASCRERVCQNV